MWPCHKVSPYEIRIYNNNNNNNNNNLFIYRRRRGTNAGPIHKVSIILKTVADF